MTTEIYTMASTAASVISMNPLVLVELAAVILAIVTGLAGRLAIWCEDLRYSRLFGRRW